MFPTSRNRQRGAALMTAIFLLVVIGALIAFLLKMSGLQHSSMALDAQGARAYQASRAGIDWGVYRALRDNSCVGSASLRIGRGIVGIYRYGHLHRYHLYGS